jgi:hypothetical protein
MQAMFKVSWNNFIRALSHKTKTHSSKIVDKKNITTTLPAHMRTTHRGSPCCYFVASLQAEADMVPVKAKACLERQVQPESQHHGTRLTIEVAQVEDHRSPFVPVSIYINNFYSDLVISLLQHRHSQLPK